MSNQLQLRRLLEACRTFEGGHADQALQKLGREFVAGIPSNVAVVDAAAAELERLPPAGAGWMAVQLGVAAEQFDTTVRSIDPIIALFRSWLARLPQPGAGFDPNDEEASPLATTREQDLLLDAMNMLIPALIAHLARSSARRHALADDAALLRRLHEVESCSHCISWVIDALQRRSNTLIVIHPLSGKGFLVSYSNITRCFHLFSLLQCALGTSLEGGREPSETIAAAARGQIDGHFDDEAWWHYGDPRNPKPLVMASIWGENRVDEIPVVRDHQVMLLWPQLPARLTWDSHFFDTSLAAFPPNVRIERQLDPAECRDWMRALHLPVSAEPEPEPAVAAAPASASWWQRWRKR